MESVLECTVAHRVQEEGSRITRKVKTMLRRYLAELEQVVSSANMVVVVDQVVVTISQNQCCNGLFLTSIALLQEIQSLSWFGTRW